VRGTASDPDGIAAVTVNGVPSDLVPAEGSEITASGLYTSVNWFVPWVLETGTNEFVVNVEDGRNEVNMSAGSATVQNIRVPTRFVLDKINDRVIGVVFSSAFQRELTSYDLGTSTQTLLSGSFEPLRPYCFQADTGEFFFLRTSNGVYSLNSVNMETLAETSWATVTIDVQAEGFYRDVFVLDLVCESGHDDVYMAYSFGPSQTNTLNDLTNSRILKFDLDSGEARLLHEFDTQNGDFTTLGGAELMGDQLVAYPLVPSPLFSINTQTGERTTLPGGENLWVLQLATDAATNQIYIVNFDAVYRVNLETGRVQIVSVVSPSSPLSLPQPRELVLDRKNNRLLIGDSDLEMIVQVSLSSGQRSEFLSRRQGEGVSIVAGRELYLSRDKRKAYVLDDGQQFAERLLEIDLATGNRREIGNLSLAQRFTEAAQGLELNEEKGVAYAAFNSSIFQVDLETEQIVQVAGNGVGFGPNPQSISDLALDKSGSRLLFSDTQNEAIVAVDLRSRVRTTLSQAGTRGAGEPFAGVSALAFDTENNRLFAANRQARNIMSIDLETRDRTVILDACPDPSGQNQLGNFDTLEGLLYRNGELLIRDLGLRRFNVDSGKCAVLLDRIPSNVSVLGMQWLNEEVLLTSGLGGVGLYDTVTGQYVLVSE